MIDFHSHIIPKVDDGSTDVEMSIDMLNHSKKDGVQYICATPHFISGEHEIEKEEYDKKVSELLENLSVDIKILSGLEVYINHDLLRLYKENKIWCINEKRYMLIELPMREFPIYTEKVFYQLRLEGITPILAHPERNLSIMKNTKLLVNLVEQGNVAQMNSGSLCGMYGNDIKRTAEKLLGMNLIHMLGSDGHNNTKRPCKLMEGYKRVRELNPTIYSWIIKNQHNIIEGKEVEIPEVRVLKKNKWFFFRLFK